MTTEDHNGDGAPQSTRRRGTVRRRTVVASAIAAGGIVAGASYGIVAATAADASSATSSTASNTASSSGAAASSNRSSSHTSTACVAPTQANPANDFDGTVTAVSTDSLSVRSLFGTSRTYSLSSSTSVHEGPTQKLTVSALHDGEHVHVRGTKSGSSYKATDVDVHPATIDGRVTSVSGSTITVTDADGFTRTIVTDSGTKYYSGTTSASSSAVADGKVVHAQGSVDSNGTSLDADSIATVTAGSGPAGGPPAAGAAGRGAPAAGSAQCGPAGAPHGAPGRGAGAMPAPPAGAPSGRPSGKPSKSASTSS